MIHLRINTKSVLKVGSIVKVSLVSIIGLLIMIIRIADTAPVTHNLKLVKDNHNEIREDQMGAKGRHNVKKPKQNAAKKPEGKSAEKSKPSK